MPRKTRTSSFGVSRREAHDSTDFYARSLYKEGAGAVGAVQSAPQEDESPLREQAPKKKKTPARGRPVKWADRIYNQSSESMPLPDESVALAFTSPPYNVGKDYDENLTLEQYLALIARVGREVYRVLKPGGRYVINIANLGRKPYIPLHAYFYNLHTEIGFLPMGEIIWQKGKGAGNNCAWGSWRSARAPRLRDLHEYLLVFSKEGFSRPEPGESDLSAAEFMESTLSVWSIAPESARKVGHPAPFPLELAERVVRLYSYKDDVVLDPFAGSGTTCLAAKQNGRHYAGFDISAEYCRIAGARLKDRKTGTRKKAEKHGQEN